MKRLEAHRTAGREKDQKVVGVCGTEQEEREKNSVMMTCDVVWCTSRKTQNFKNLKKKKGFPDDRAKTRKGAPSQRHLLLLLVQLL